MARSYGANASLLLKRESTYGQQASGDYIRMPFNRCSLGSEQGLIDDPVLGQGRDPLAPLLDVINDEGDIVVPVDKKSGGKNVREGSRRMVTVVPTPTSLSNSRVQAPQRQGFFHPDGEWRHGWRRAGIGCLRPTAGASLSRPSLHRSRAEPKNCRRRRRGRRTCGAPTGYAPCPYFTRPGQVCRQGRVQGRTHRQRAHGLADIPPRGLERPILGFISDARFYPALSKPHSRRPSVWRTVIWPSQLASAVSG